MERSGYGREERFVVQNVRGRVGLGARAQHNDNQFLVRVDVDVLAEDAFGLEGALMDRIA